MPSPTNERADSMEENDTGAAPEKVRRKWHMDAATRILTMTEPNGSKSTYPLANLPAASLDHATSIGLILLLGRADNPDVAFEKLERGEFRVAAEPKAPKVNEWRLAIAHALVDATKKSDAPLTLDQAKERAAVLNVQQVGAQKTDLTVIKHYHKIRGTQPAGVMSLLAA